MLRRAETQDVLLIGIGSFVPTALAVAERAAEQGIGVTVVDPRWVRPVDPALVELARGYRLVVTLEDGVRAGGVGTAIAQALRDADVDVPLRDLGVPVEWHPHGSRARDPRRHRPDRAGRGPQRHRVGLPPRRRPGDHGRAEHPQGPARRFLTLTPTLVWATSSVP